MAVAPIPRIAHFVYGLRHQDEPFHLVHYLALASCRVVLAPEEIAVHCHELPYGYYWDLIRPHVTLRRVEPVAVVTDHDYDDPVVAHSSYAHHADFVRLDVLAREGGLYADIDTLFVAPLPNVWDADCVVGRERDVVDPRTGSPRSSVSNALVMARPSASFVERWRDEMVGAFDGSWAAHSCFLADDLARRFPDEVHVEPARTFHEFPPTPEGLRRLLVDDETDLGGIASIHLLAHLWWDEGRRDFSPVHGRLVTHQWIERSHCTYARAARRFLPDAPST